jgi:hypothetical protein
MIVEIIPIRDHPLCPTPDHVKVLRLIRIDSVMSGIYYSENQNEKENARCRPQFGT